MKDLPSEKITKSMSRVVRRVSTKRITERKKKERAKLDRVSPRGRRGKSKHLKISAA